MHCTSKSSNHTGVILVHTNYLFIIVLRFRGCFSTWNAFLFFRTTRWINAPAWPRLVALSGRNAAVAKNVIKKSATGSTRSTGQLIEEIVEISKFFYLFLLSFIWLLDILTRKANFCNNNISLLIFSESICSSCIYKVMLCKHDKLLLFSSVYHFSCDSIRICK